MSKAKDGKEKPVTTKNERPQARIKSAAEMKLLQDLRFSKSSYMPWGRVVIRAIDFDDCLKLLKAIKKENFEDINLKDVIKNLHVLKEVDVNKEIKLPNNQSIVLLKYLDRFKSKNYTISKKIKVK